MQELSVQAQPRPRVEIAFGSMASLSALFSGVAWLWPSAALLVGLLVALAVVPLSYWFWKALCQSHAANFTGTESGGGGDVPGVGQRTGAWGNDGLETSPIARRHVAAQASSRKRGPEAGDGILLSGPAHEILTPGGAAQLRANAFPCEQGAGVSFKAVEGRRTIEPGSTSCAALVPARRSPATLAFARSAQGLRSPALRLTGSRISPRAVRDKR